MHGQEVALRAEHARDFASLRDEHESALVVLERRIQSLESVSAFYLTELAAYQAKERHGFPQHFDLASDGAGVSGEE
eukprot:353630-Lingulodinium_polyedra.AAC.1